MNKLLTLLLLLGLTATCFAQGFYVEFKMSSIDRGNTFNGNMKAFSQDGNTRSEIDMKVPQMPGGGIKMTSLILKATPDKIYMLNEKDKTYSEMSTGSSEEWKEHTPAEYEVTLVGKETVNGYNTTHVIIKVNGKQQEELWTTKDIAGYVDFSKIKSKYTGSANMYKALAAKGADGMPVRIKAMERGQGMQMDLVKAEKRNNPASLYSLSGYTKGSGFAGAPGGEAMQEMMEKMKNMTPAEREEMLKKLQQHYGQEPPHH